MSKYYIDAENKNVGATILLYLNDVLYYMPENLMDPEMKEVESKDYLKLMASDALVCIMESDSGNMRVVFLKDIILASPNFDGKQPNKISINDFIPTEIHIDNGESGGSGGSSEFVGIYYDKENETYYTDSKFKNEISYDDLWEYYKKDARVYFDYRWHSFTSYHTRSGQITLGILPSEKRIYVDTNGKYYANKSWDDTYSNEITDGYELRNMFEEGCLIDAPDGSTYRPVGFDPSTDRFVFDVPEYLK